MATPDTVTLALPSNAARIAELQRTAWARRFPGLALPADAELTWAEAITKPPLAQCRVLVAHGADEVVGFATLNPGGDVDAESSDGEISEFVADGDAADRLLHACIDTLRKDGFTRATWWLPSTDDERRTWLTEAGWGVDGAHQELRDGDIHLKLVRLHTAL